MWKTAASLRPNTGQLALACISGDEEALAVANAWRFQTSRATRLVIRSASDPCFQNVTTFEGGGGVYASKRNTDPQFKKVALDQKEVNATVESAFAGYAPNDENSSRIFGEALMMAARKYVSGFKFASFRKVGWGDDLVSSLCEHALQKIHEGKFGGLSPFHHWLTKVFFNHACDALNEFTDERVTLVGITSDEPNEDGLVEKGYISESQLPRLDEQGDTASSRISSTLSLLTNEADRTYAQFIMLGMKQKDVAKQMGESTVTARKRQDRIEGVMRQHGFGEAAGGPSEAAQQVSK